MSLYMIIKNGESRWVASIGRSLCVVSADEAAWIFHMMVAGRGAV
ncbi:TPA: hypothetical protein ACGUPM_002678 [Vibrio vulnificus]